MTPHFSKGKFPRVISHHQATSTAYNMAQIGHCETRFTSFWKYIKLISKYPLSSGKVASTLLQNVINSKLKSTVSVWELSHYFVHPMRFSKAIYSPTNRQFKGWRHRTQQHTNRRPPPLISEKESKTFESEIPHLSSFSAILVRDELMKSSTAADKSRQDGSQWSTITLNIDGYASPS